jgi:hypothetical protein
MIMNNEFRKLKETAENRNGSVGAQSGMISI